MKTNKSLRVGIVGCAGAAEWHISSMLKIKNSEPIAIWDKNKDLVRKVSGRLNNGLKGSVHLCTQLCHLPIDRDFA